MKKSKRKSKLIIKPLLNPYRENDNDTIGIIYRKYIDDENSIIYRQNLIYYKVLQSFLFQIKSTEILALVDIRMNLHIDDILIDENKNTYRVKGFEMIRLNSTDFPEWYTKVVHVLLEGNPDSIGEYLALYKSTY